MEDVTSEFRAFFHAIAQLGVLKIVFFFFIAEINAGLIEGNRIERTEHANIRNDRGIIEAAAIAPRRDIHDE